MRADLSYLLRFDDEVMEMARSTTLGRHLDADIVVAGEDVLDFHIRIEIDDRGPMAVPLQDATFSVNGVERATPYGLAIGDTLGVGSQALQIGVEREQPNDADEWWLHRSAHQSGDEAPLQLSEDLLVGRQGDCDLVVQDDHISRHHARVRTLMGSVWITDLDSANGTRINDEKVLGSRRLLHGDLVRFDEVAYQLIGQGGELTGVRTRSPDDLRPLEESETSQSLGDRPAGSVADKTEFVQAANPVLQVSEPTGPGHFLIGASHPVEDAVFQLGHGRALIGRDPAAQIRLQDGSVSTRHAELVVRPEGVTLTNLMSTNGTLVNEEPVRVVRLSDRDVVSLGRVQLIFRQIEAESALSGDQWRQHLPKLLTGTAVVIALAAWLLLSG